MILFDVHWVVGTKNFIVLSVRTFQIFYLMKLEVKLPYIIILPNYVYLYLGEESVGFYKMLLHFILE